MIGPACEGWYTVQAMVVKHLDAGFILITSFIRLHQMQVSYTNPRPFFIFENKRRNKKEEAGPPPLPRPQGDFAIKAKIQHL